MPEDFVGMVCICLPSPDYFSHHFQGEKCRHKHVRKVLCDNYFLGFCPAGPNCKFGHPQEVTKEIEMSDTTQRKTPVVCHKCGVTGHKAGQCPNFNEERVEREKRPLEAVTCFKVSLTHLPSTYQNSRPQLSCFLANHGFF